MELIPWVSNDGMVRWVAIAFCRVADGCGEIIIVAVGSTFQRTG